MDLHCKILMNPQTRFQFMFMYMAVLGGLNISMSNLNRAVLSLHCSVRSGHWDIRKSRLLDKSRDGKAKDEF